MLTGLLGPHVNSQKIHNEFEKVSFLSMSNVQSTFTSILSSFSQHSWNIYGTDIMIYLHVIAEKTEWATEGQVLYQRKNWGRVHHMWTGPWHWFALNAPHDCQKLRVKNQGYSAFFLSISHLGHLLKAHSLASSLESLIPPSVGCTQIIVNNCPRSGIFGFTLRI